MKLPGSLTSLFALLVASALANTEKAIFTAPEAVSSTDSGPTLDVLQLQTLSHTDYTLRTSLNVVFPSEEAPQGSDHWFLLRDLNPRQRYELRVCWAAIQPTEFWLDVYTTSEVFDTPALIQNLAEYAEKPDRKRPASAPSAGEIKESILFLHVRAAADFFTADKALMSSPPSVDVDLILDPYVFNVFPRSLGPTAGYIVVLAVSAWIVSGLIFPNVQTSSVYTSISQASNINMTAENMIPDGEAGNASGAESSASDYRSQPIWPNHPFYRLPDELILDIIDLLTPDAFINFAFANYPFLHARGLAPALSRSRIDYITNRTNIPALFPLFRMPPEITLEIMQNLNPLDMMRFVLANYQHLARQGITPALTEDTLSQLRNALDSGFGPGS